VNRGAASGAAINRDLPGHSFAVVLAGAVLAVWLAVMAVALRDAALPDATDGMVLAVFPPGTSEHDAFAAMVRAGGQPLRNTGLGFAWVAWGPAVGFVGRLKAEGAWAAFGELPVGPVLAGCFPGPLDGGAPTAVRLRQGPGDAKGGSGR
jgi:hypothetical protein